MSTPSYYHGGPSGLDEIKPPSETGAKHSAQVGPKDLREAAKRVHRADRVYVATQFAAAALFASGHFVGVVYEVEPIGPLEADPDCSLAGLSFACERAKVLRVHRLSPQDMATLRSVLMGCAP